MKRLCPGLLGHRPSLWGLYRCEQGLGTRGTNQRQYWGGNLVSVPVDHVLLLQGLLPKWWRR